MDSYKFDGGEISLVQNNVLLIEYEAGLKITTRHLFEMKKLREKLIGNQSFHAITDSRDGAQNFSDEAVAFINDENQSSTTQLSDAIIVNSFAKKIEIEMHNRFNRPAIKTKVFTDLNKALCWVENLETRKTELV